MTAITLTQLAELLRADLPKGLPSSTMVSNVSIHSGQVSPGTAFFALRGAITDGHRYVQDALDNGAAVAVVSRHAGPLSGSDFQRALVVDDTLKALQELAAWWRGQCSAKVIGIAGSQGKTIAKDAIRQLLGSACYASPGSFNSQLGVPLAILQMPQNAEFGVFESSVSEPGEMASHAFMLRPDIGVLTNVGWAHISTFGSRQAIAAELMRLFEEVPESGFILMPGGDALLEEAARNLRCSIKRFGEQAPSIVGQRIEGGHTVLTVRYPEGSDEELLVPEVNAESIAGLEVALGICHQLGMARSTVVKAVLSYVPQLTRREVWKSPNGVTVINDTDAADPISVGAALRTLKTLSSAEGRRIFLFGGIEAQAPQDFEFAQVGSLAAKSGVDELLLLGGDFLTSVQQAFDREAPGRNVRLFSSNREARDYLVPSLRWGDALLIKGPPGTGVASVAKDIVEGMAPTRFYIDLKAVSENIQRIRSGLQPNTKVLAMVKALGYGTDSVQLSHELQTMGVDFIGVSSADEGVQLRRAGIRLPILVMMCTRDEVEKLPRYGLTPVLYSHEIASAIAQAVSGQGTALDVHIEVDTGMGRTGVQPKKLLELARHMRDLGCLNLRGLMTHFPAADMPEEDEFTKGQMTEFRALAAELEDEGFHDLLLHASATAAAVRMPGAQFGMVRVGLGVYGVYPSPSVGRERELVLAIAFVSRIVEIQEFERGATIGYGRTFAVDRDEFRGAIVPAGYHDGVPWKFAEGGSVLIDGRPAPVCGRISMDSMVVDVSDIPSAVVGSEVLIYGRRGDHTLRPEESARTAGTIPYELLARLGPRVQRIFVGR